MALSSLSTKSNLPLAHGAPRICLMRLLFLHTVRMRVFSVFDTPPRGSPYFLKASVLRGHYLVLVGHL